jgi:hypothetical protein
MIRRRLLLPPGGGGAIFRQGLIACTSSDKEVTVGYFDALSGSGFKKDEQGRSVFYPWGVFGKGRVLPDAETEKKVRAFVVRYYVISIVLLAIAGVGFGWVYALALVPLLMIWYHFKSRAMIAACPEAGDKLTLKESYVNSSRALNRKVLWSFLILSVLFAVGGLLILLVGTSGYDRIHGGGILLFFGLCAVVFGYMIRAKRQ